MKATIPITIPAFLVDTRISHCLFTNCKFNGIREYEELTCRLKQVQLDDSGKCKNYELLETKIKVNTPRRRADRASKPKPDKQSLKRKGG